MSGLDQKANHCPVCGSDKLDWDGGDMFDDAYAYKWSCTVCESYGREWNDLTFSHHEIFERGTRHETDS